AGDHVAAPGGEDGGVVLARRDLDPGGQQEGGQGTDEPVLAELVHPHARSAAFISRAAASGSSASARPRITQARRTPAATSRSRLDPSTPPMAKTGTRTAALTALTPSGPIAGFAGLIAVG